MRGFARFVAIVPVLVLLVWTTPVAQSLPTTQPKIISIYRERVKLGHEAAHAITESGWPAAYAQAKSTDYYMALTSLTGAPEAWFIAPWDSYATWGKALERDQTNPELSAALGRLGMADAQHLDGLEILEAVAVPELGQGPFLDLARVRFTEITQMRVRPGHEQHFAEAAKVYKALATRSAPSIAWRVYSVTKGMPGPTYLIFSSVQNFGQFDAVMAGGDALRKGAKPEEMVAIQKFNTEGVISTVSNRYRLDPSMSYVPAETKATDPAFWNKK